MKIAITATGPTFDSLIDMRFGRAVGFIIYDDQAETFNFVDNEQTLNAPQGAGIQAAKIISDNKVEVLITGNIGPKAFIALKAAAIDIIRYLCGK